MRNHSSLHSAQIKRSQLVKRSQLGFTLVELLLVILVLSSLALATTFLVDGLYEQSRFDDTKTRLQQIRQAIVGDTSRTLNGQPEIRGFVADMGRLPLNIKELLEIGDQVPWALNALSAGDISSGISPVLTIRLDAGWRGPYLDTLPDSSDGQRRFRDGWGNGDLSDVNFGWQYTADDLSGVSVQSLGANGIADVTPETVYDADYPPTGVDLLGLNDYGMSLSSVNVQLNQPITVEPSDGSVNRDLVLRIYYIGYDDILVDPNDLEILQVESDPIITTPALVGQQTLSFNVGGGPYYLGNYAAVLLCDNLVIYDGDCDEPHINTQPYYFRLIPRAQLPIIPWNIQ
jgi:prepilin-type N-terminal cleavage/methylation domain-containing protein